MGYSLGITIPTAKLGPWTEPSEDPQTRFKAFWKSFDKNDATLRQSPSDKANKGNEYPLAERQFFRYRPMNARELALLTRFVVGQKVTKACKVPTMLDGDTVMKGPFRPTAKVLALVFHRSRQFKAWGDKAFLPWEVVQDPETNHFYLSTVNMGKLPEEVVWDLYYQYENKGNAKALTHGPLFGWKLPRIREGSVERDRGGVSRVSDEIAARGDVPRKMWFGIMYHLLVRYVLRGGDTGFWNFINGIGIDFEEVRGFKGTKPVSLYASLFSGKRAIPAIVRRKAQSYLEEDREALLKRFKKYVRPSKDTVFETPNETRRARWMYKLLKEGPLFDPSDK